MIKHYVLIQPPSPPGNPGDPSPRQPVPIAGTIILIVAAILLGFYFLWKKKIKKQN